MAFAVDVPQDRRCLRRRFGLRFGGGRLRLRRCRFCLLSLLLGTLGFGSGMRLGVLQFFHGLHQRFDLALQSLDLRIRRSIGPCGVRSERNAHTQDGARQKSSTP